MSENGVFRSKSARFLSREGRMSRDQETLEKFCSSYCMKCKWSQRHCVCIASQQSGCWWFLHPGIYSVWQIVVHSDRYAIDEKHKFSPALEYCVHCIILAAIVGNAGKRKKENFARCAKNRNENGRGKKKWIIHISASAAWSCRTDFFYAECRGSKRWGRGANGAQSYIYRITPP